MRRMEKITGRSDDMLIIRGVNVFPTQIEEILLKNPNLCAQYQLMVARDGHLDTLDVYVEVKPDLSDKVSEARRRRSVPRSSTTSRSWSASLRRCMWLKPTRSNVLWSARPNA
jgi:phenylacetate-coenzyme A ligase PaaK-like adenylate-forming protein